MSQRFLKRAKRNDKLARWAITGGGLVIIASVIAILLLILKVTLPLFEKPRASLALRMPMGLSTPGSAVLAVGTDEYVKTGYAINDEGSVAFYIVADHKPAGVGSLTPPCKGARLVQCARTDASIFTLLWSDGTAQVLKIAFASSPASNEKPSLKILSTFPSAPDFRNATRALAQWSDESNATCVRLLPGNRFSVTQRQAGNELLGEETKDVSSVIESGVAGRVTSFALSRKGDTLYAGTSEGVIAQWDLSDPGKPVSVDRVPTFPDRAAVTALAFVLGDESLAVGDARGRVTTWSHVRTEGGARKLRLIHTLAAHRAAVDEIVPSPRSKALASRDRNGVVHVDYMTTERPIASLGASEALSLVAFSPRGNALAAANAQGQIAVWKLQNPHPEASPRTLFGKVWYEGYDAPAYVWQSSSGNEDFEPKLSLVPLIFGTLKGAFYAMLFAVPLALAGALYTSQFAGPRFRQWVKPAVEVMASIPSVVIGFLAALWLAPLLEARIVPFFLCILLIPAVFLGFLMLWQVPRRSPAIRRFEKGHEFLIVMPVLLASVGLALALGPWVEGVLFGGSFKQWLFDSWGMRYEQRNCVVVGFGLGFAVIPIIFTMAEDALSNVPYSLTVGSLALGASRWQTAWHVILPSASPGIFAGIMIGFGRAVGETMIVLMATGNTAIMDWSIFNGMRTLSANIAVEIAEAPLGGTLYRVLFLSAVLLFALTFILNTGAEIIRHRLRERYGRFQ